MELLLMNTAQGLKPMYDEDYDEKRKLQIGTIYKAKITVPLNLDLFALIMEGEIWKPIEGFNGLYEISNKGRVKSLKRFTQRTYKGRKTKGFERHQIIMRPANNGKGYLWVSLTKDGKSYHKYIHRLVGAAFVEKPSVDGKSQINHKDGNKQNNVASNLEWCSARENNLHRYNVLMKRNPYKGREVSWNRKRIGLYEDGVLSREFESLRECSTFLGKNYTWLSGVLHGKKKSLFDIRLI